MGIIKATYVNWEFDTAKWAEAIAEACKQHGAGTIAALTGCSVGVISSWRNGNYKVGFEYPSMTLFMRVCNLLDLNPQDFFKVELE